MRLLSALARGLRGRWVARRYSRDGAAITIELRQKLPVVALAILLAWYVAAPTEVTTMALAALGAMLLAGFLWARAMALGVAAQRRLEYAALQVGEELEEQVTLDNATSLPVLWAEFADQSDLPGYSLTSVWGADAQASSHWRVRALCSRRGLFRLGPWELRLGDPLGLFLVRQVYAQQQELLVYPPLAPMPAHLLPRSATLGDHRLLRQPLPAETINATTTRPYLPGDPLRHVHWRTWARRDEPYAKVFEPESTSTVWLIPDFDRAAHMGQGEDSSEETMVLVAASLADHLLRQGLSVGLLAHAGTPQVVMPRPGPAHLWPILRALAPLRADCPQPLAAILPHLVAPVSARDLIVVITPSLDTEWPRAVRSRSAPHRGGDVATAILLDPASFGGQGQAAACVLALAEQGVLARTVARGELRPISSLYGPVRRWEFMTLGTGRAVARQRPRGAGDGRGGRAGVSAS